MDRGDWQATVYGLQRVGHDWCDLEQHNQQENVRSLSNCAGEDSWESLGLQGDQTSQSQRKSTLNIHWKDWGWSWSSNTLITWCEELTQWKRPWCWKRLRAGWEKDDRGWDDWIAAPTQWTWIWANSRKCWRTDNLSLLQSMGSQRVRPNLVSEQQQQ